MLNKDLESLREATKSLVGTEGFWYAIVESSLDGIIIANKFGEIMYANPTAHAVFKYEHGEMVGLNVGVLAGGEHLDKHNEYILRYLHSGEAKILGKMNRHMIGKDKFGEDVDVILGVSEVKNGSHFFVAHVRLDSEAE